eukprot:TRINITY_DN10819_c0_g1_i2.p1 TRINITY_DN10819_c0_g1~~TRINITY_DN10819_c0_g1_i2.p1  ORF type:complete len:203 (+),score=38.65 TRINITY_DN10819_c0_g1_i2:81-689(+)
MSTPKLPRLASISRQSSSGSTVEQGLDRVEKLDKKLKKIAAKEKQVKQQRAQPAESDAKDTFFLTQIDADKQKSPTDAGAAGEAALTRAAGVLSASERHRLRHLLQEIDHLSEEELSQESALAPHLSELQAIDAKLQALRPGHTVTVLDDARTLHGEVLSLENGFLFLHDTQSLQHDACALLLAVFISHDRCETASSADQGA